MFTEEVEFWQKKQINKLMLKPFSDVNLKMEDIEHKSQTFEQQFIDELIDQEFKIMKLKRCTHEFSTPEIAYEALDLMRKDEFNFKNCKVMKKVNKMTADLKGRVSNKTVKEAVEYAITKDCYSGGKVRVFNLDGEEVK